MIAQHQHPSGRGDAEVVGAKLGLALLVLHAHEKVGAAEHEAFAALVARQVRLADGEAGRFAERLLAIPSDLLELTYLARVLVDALDPAQRRAYVDDLAGMALADGSRSFDESRTIRLIAKYLYVSASS